MDHYANLAHVVLFECPGFIYRRFFTVFVGKNYISDGRGDIAVDVNGGVFHVHLFPAFDCKTGVFRVFRVAAHKNRTRLLLLSREMFAASRSG